MLPVRNCLLFVFAIIAVATFLGSTRATTLREGNPHKFDVYWNVPTFMCHKYGMKFENLNDYGIQQNAMDKFRGDKIVILYDPGMFPALLVSKNGTVTKRNGGVPQEGDLKEHLEKFREDLVTQIPHESFSGVAVIDFESWRPIFRQNWASLEPYKTLSIKLERERHPFWSDAAVKKEAKRRFEKFGRMFMEESLKMAKKLRPWAMWGYYGYPHCFNKSPGQQSMHCDRSTMTENDEMSWLFMLEDVHAPSVYLRLEIKEGDRPGFVKGRVSEAQRLAVKSLRKQQILPYYWFKYQDNRDKLLSEKDTMNTIEMIANHGADGAIIWGSSNDVNTQRKCEDLLQYMKDVLGPTVKRLSV
ncbi:hyaluronidase-like [Harpegnathos saltator]|uniref:hyaluronidase-like n=1 Tax=Harpegnathos saltator TaxID=610380 RepID=UPI00058B4AE0|nr:hyaluronidase-like [Harpegnathos saltator]